MTGSYDFDPTGREQWQSLMAAAGYVELEQFPPHLDGFSCASCEYMRKMKGSPTGFWCVANKPPTKKPFPDRPNGCCDYWEPMPGLLDESRRKKT
jgi:hypothetical protein